MNKWLSGWACSYLPDGCVVASCAGLEMHSLLPFDEWKELQINATAEKVRKVKEEHSVDIGLRLYDLSYRLTLELARIRPFSIDSTVILGRADKDELFSSVS